MIDIEYANAYAEISEILKYISKEDYEKIPKIKIKLFNEYMNKNHIFKYDPNKTLNEQNVSKRTKAIILLLYRDYWATDKEREEFIQKQKNNEIILESYQKSSNDLEEIFYNKEIQSHLKSCEENNKLEKYDNKNIFSIFFNKLIKLIRRK